MFQQFWHLPLHECVEHRHREGGFSVPLAPNHALGDEMLAHHGDGGGPYAQRFSDAACAVRPRPEFGHSPEVLLLKGRQPVEANAEEIVVELRYHAGAGGANHRASDWACGSGRPRLGTPTPG